MQKKRADEWRHARFEIGGGARKVNGGKVKKGFFLQMSENARAHRARRLAEAEYLDEHDSRRREHKEPGISCNILKAETRLLGDLPPDVAVEIDTAAGNISRIEHAGRKVDAAGTGGMGIHHAQQERTIAG